MSIFRLAMLFAVAVISMAAAEAQILWKISGHGGPDSYIIGTHHVAPASMLDGIAGFNDAFAVCSQLYGEIDMESATQDVAAQSMKYAMAPADSTLGKVLTADEMKMVDAATQKYFHLPAAQFDLLKPAALSAQIAVMQAAATFKGFDPSQQIDALLQQKAKERGMKVGGLETAEYQLQVLFGSPISCQAQDLMKMLRDETLYMEYTRMLADIYARQDLDAMLEMIGNSEMGMSQYELDTLLYGRNEAWTEKLVSTILPQASTFIVVGAGHLPGEKGVLSLLRKAGYTVTPVK